MFFVLGCSRESTIDRKKHRFWLPIETQVLGDDLSESNLKFSMGSIVFSGAAGSWWLQR